MDTHRQPVLKQEAIDALLGGQASAIGCDWLMEVSTVGIVITDEEGTIRLVNKEAGRLFGYSASELIGQTVELLIPERLRTGHVAHRHAYMQAPKSRAICTGVTLYGRRRDGSEFPLEAGLSPLPTEHGLMVATTVIDISARRSAEQALLQAQKMDAIGQLTGGIAHDFNNLLTVIGGNLQLLEERLAPDDPNRALITSATNAANRGGDLVRGLLSLARKQVSDAQSVNLMTVCRDLLPLFERTLGEDIAVRLDGDPQPWAVSVELARLESALLNLAINARDAMTAGGRLLIEVRNHTVDEPVASLIETIPPGDYVTLSVQDTGAGMSEDTLAHVLEPFFTTKQSGKGTGLGVPMVYRCIKEADGYLSIESQPGSGTTVTLHFPRTRTIS